MGEQYRVTSDGQFDRLVGQSDKNCGGRHVFVFGRARCKHGKPD